MKVLFDLVHPADALLFHHAIRLLERNGADVHVASREKDVLLPLLDALGHAHTPISRAGSGRTGLAIELARRDWRLWKLARSFRPDAMVGFGGVAISHVGKLTGIPSLSLYDTEHAKLQIRLTLPFITEWHVPSSWKGEVAPGKTRYFESGKQFAYLHPAYFQPSGELAIAAGFDPTQDNFLIRTVSWTANHDHGRSGIATAQLRTIIGALGGRGKVHISAEGELPPDLEPMRYKGTALQFHHLLAHCRLYCGESITIASEAVMLGVPVLLQIDKEYGYVAEQEAVGLIRRFGPKDEPVAVLENILQGDLAAFKQRATAFVEGGGDLTAYIVDQVNRVANSYRSTVRRNS